MRASSRLVCIMSPTILPRRYAPAAIMQSSYLALLGCQLLSQGGPGVRLARHRWQRQALRRQRCTARPLFTRPVWPRRALRSHDYQCAQRKLSVHAVALCSPCAHHAPHYTAKALRAETAAYATLARSSTRFTYAERACSSLFLALRASCSPRYCPGRARASAFVLLSTFRIRQDKE